MEIMHKGMWTGRRVLYLSVDAIRANPDQPRKYFEPEALRELAESIGRYGILQPLTVRRGEDGYELIAGERRLRAAKLAGLREVPCLAVRSDEEESALLFPGVYANDYYTPFTPYGQLMLSQALQAAFGGRDIVRPFPALVSCLNHLLEMIQEMPPAPSPFPGPVPDAPSF